MEKVARPERVTRFYVAGREVDPEQFWEAVRLAGGEATVVAHDPKPLQEREEDARYTLTELGRRALAQEEAGG